MDNPTQPTKISLSTPSWVSENSRKKETTRSTRSSRQPNEKNCIFFHMEPSAAPSVWPRRKWGRDHIVSKFNHHSSFSNSHLLTNGIDIKFTLMGITESSSRSKKENGVVIGFILGLLLDLSQPGKGQSKKNSISVGKVQQRSLVTSNGDEELKMVLVVRRDLKMTTGKIASQCAHAATGVYAELMQSHRSLLRQWEQYGQPKIVVTCKNQQEMNKLKEAAEGIGLPTFVVADAGRTQVVSGSKTVLAVGPVSSRPNPTAAVEIKIGRRADMYLQLSIALIGISFSKPAFSFLKSTVNKPTVKPRSMSSLPTTRPSLTLSRPTPQLGSLQSLLPFHSAVSSARLTSCLGIDSRSSRSLSQGMLGANPGSWVSACLDKRLKLEDRG
ncbi:Peptidyl-tRNA hydrolase II family protein [Prunus dulcis]|uniref:peptidyl-tRNA hydrolase n=1 Tax=Prunus dulcis TaxID=3755 RepID=A0A4Y1QU16_PRUDU|nr:Peptidyl-tRNA hydrolase II family protein [Prunus dulcis]